MDLGDPALVVMAPASAAVLRVMVRAPGARFTMRELAAVAGISHNAAQTVVHRLADHGVVLTEPAGRAILCRFNGEHLAAGALAGLVTLRDRLLELLTAEVSAWAIQPLHTSLFGSAARGDGSTTSDLDLLVIRPSLRTPGAVDSWEEQLVASAQRLRLVTGNPVNVVDLDRTGLHEAVTSDEPIVDSWRTDAIHLGGQRLTTLLRAAE